MTQSYDDFVEKFKPKKTTDDCYTPPEIYEAVADYVSDAFGIGYDRMLRPFYPGGDYENYNYPDGCCVVDNPPFSILSKIKRFYTERNIPFFLFAPALTAFSGYIPGTCVYAISADIEYANGAKVRTAFITNLNTEDALVVDQELNAAVNKACAIISARQHKQLPKYTYPAELMTMSRAMKYARSGVSFALPSAECVKVGKLAAMPAGKGIFGGALLMSRAQTENATEADTHRPIKDEKRSHVWALSDEEREIVNAL